MMKSINKLLFQFGLTEETKIEWSETLHMPVSVVSKKYEEEHIMGGEMHIMTLEETLKKYFIIFKSKRENREISLILNNENLFKIINEGDTAELEYVRLYGASYDYLPPDFKNKTRVKREFIGNVPLRIMSDILPTGKYELPVNVKERIMGNIYRRHYSK